MKRLLRSRFVLTLAALIMVAAAIGIPLSSSIAHTHAASTTTVLSENFETGAPGWTTTGFWHIQDHPEAISVLSPDINPNLVTLPDSGKLPAAFNGTHAAWFGEASTGTYCGSDFNTITQTPKDGCTSTQVHSGELTSPAFSLAGATSAEVQFQAWWEIESVNADTFDLMTVEYSIDSGASWQQAGKLNPVNNPAGKHDQSYTANGIEQPAQWNQDIVDLSGAAGQSNVQIRFTFNTVDTLYQGFRGWFVDNVVVSTPFVSPNPSIASLNPACVSSTASLPVTVTGSNFVSGSTVLLDGTNANGAVLSDQTIEFTANNLAVGNHTVQVISPNGAKSNTVTLVSALSCSSPKKTLFVLLQGIDTDFNGKTGNYPGFDQAAANGRPEGIKPFLTSNGYSGANFLEYSYPIDKKGQDQGITHPYTCVDTFSHTLNQDARTLNLQIDNYLKQPGHQNTNIYLIAHSLGGAVAFGYLAYLESRGWPALPNGGHLQGVVTLDSPIGGIPGGIYGYVAVQYYRLFDKCSALSGHPVSSVDALKNIYRTVANPPASPQGGNASIMQVVFPIFGGGTLPDNQQLATDAKQHNISILTIGNFLDYLWDPFSCAPAYPSFISTQWVSDQGSNSDIYGRLFIAGKPVCSNIFGVGDNHGVVLTNNAVEQGLLQFLSGGTPDALTPA